MFTNTKLTAVALVCLIAAGQGYAQEAQTGATTDVTAPATPLPPGTSIAPAQAELARKAAKEVVAQTGLVTLGNAGRVVMVYGQALPTLICKPNLVCTLELEPGEMVSDTQVLSDAVRWEVALRYREEPKSQAFFMFKARSDAEEANFTVVTDRRVYSILLVPDPTRFTPILSFHYPDTAASEVAARIAEEKAKRASAKAAKVATYKSKVAKTGVATDRGEVPADALDFNYAISGKADFRPLRVYTDGRKTYVDLPPDYRGEVPMMLAGRGNSNATINIVAAKGGRQLIADKALKDFDLVVGKARVRVTKSK